MSTGQTSGLAWCIPPGQRKQSSVRPGSSHRGSAESRRRSVDGRRPRDPVHPSVRRCNPLSTAAAQSKSPGSKFFRKKRLSPREHGACCCDCDRGAPAHDVIGTPDTPPCGAATLAARQRPAPAPDPTPTAAEIFRVPNKKSINFLSDCNELLAQSCSRRRCGDGFPYDSRRARVQKRRAAPPEPHVEKK